jgi:hypothetical protein
MMVLGTLLCLLTALFAVEAKVAWFGLDGSASMQISAAKLQPADAPKVTSPLDLPAFPIAWFPQVAVVLALALAWRRESILPRRLNLCTVPGSPRFYPSLFFRPPPGA